MGICRESLQLGASGSKQPPLILNLQAKPFPIGWMIGYEEEEGENLEKRNGLMIPSEFSKLEKW